MPRTLSTPGSTLRRDSLRRSSTQPPAGSSGTTSSNASPVGSAGGRLTGPGSYAKWRDAAATASASARSWGRPAAARTYTELPSRSLTSPRSSRGASGASLAHTTQQSATPRRQSRTRRSTDENHSETPPSPQQPKKRRVDPSSFISAHLRDASERRPYSKLLPDWVQDAVLNDNYPNPKLGKVRFELLSENPEEVPSLGRGARLTSPPNLRVLQVYNYLEQQFERVDFGDISRDEDGELLPLQDFIEVVCEGQVLEPMDDLQTVRDLIKKSGTSLVLYYRLKPEPLSTTSDEVSRESEPERSFTSPSSE